jgi:hypothetical protein
MILGEALYGRDLLSLHVPHGSDTGAVRLAINVNGAGPTFPNTAGILGSGQFKMVPDHPE